MWECLGRSASKIFVELVKTKTFLSGESKDVVQSLCTRNVKLEYLEQDIEKTEGKMGKARAKMDEFVEKSNFCCLYIVILLEIVALFCVIFFV